MAISLKKGKHTYWIDAEGLEVPLKHISAEDKERDKLVEDVVNMAIDLREIISKTKQEMREKISAYLDSVADRYDEEWQGNAVITSYSGNKQVQIRQHKLIGFDEKLQVAKSKIDKCIIAWAKGSRLEIVALVNLAFQVDKKGNLDAKALLKLTRLEINDPVWQEAMGIIKDSVQVLASKEYFNFKVKNKDGHLAPLTLQFSQL